MENGCLCPLQRFKKGKTLTGLHLKAACLATALFAGTAANAHVSYLLPTTFNTSEGNYVTLVSSFTDKFPHAEIAVRSDDYHVIRPDGSRDEYKAINAFRQMVLLESELEEEGTYRFTTGLRLGREGKYAEVDGKFQSIFVEEGEPKVPENATRVVTGQTATVADVYVSKGAPTWTAVEQTVGPLVLKPDLHPNEIYFGDELTFDVLFDGEPLAGQSMELTRQGGEYEDPKFEKLIDTDENGQLKLNFDKPGLYLLMTRHQADAPEGADTDIRSYTTSITFEVLR